MFVVPEQIVVAPVIALGVSGAEFTVIACVEAELAPQLFVAVTETLPLVVLAVALIELLVLAPVQPKGKVQV